MSKRSYINKYGKEKWNDLCLEHILKKETWKFSNHKEDGPVTNIFDNPVYFLLSQCLGKEDFNIWAKRVNEVYHAREIIERYV